MRRQSIPPWLSQLWAELTKPPKVLQSGSGRSGSPVRRPRFDPGGSASYPRPEGGSPLQPPSKSRLKRSRGQTPPEGFFDSPTDATDERLPWGTTKSAIRAGQKYFIPRRSSPKPVSKPRPRRGRAGSLKPPAGKAAPQGAQQNAGTDAASRAPSSSESVAPIRAGGTAQTPLAKTETASLSIKRKASEIASAYGERVRQAEPAGGVWRLETSSGRAMALKRTELPVERLQFIANALDHVAKGGLANVPAILRTEAGQPYVRSEGQLFYAMEWIEGRRVELASPRQTGAAARTLARLNELSRSYRPTNRPKDAFDVFERLLKRKQRLADAGEQLRLENSDFSALAVEALKNADAQASDSLGLLKLPEAQEQLEADRSRAGLCHLDVTRRNLLLRSDHSVALVDFDQMAIGPRVLDLAHLIRRAMQSVGSWSNEMALAPLISYNRVRPLAPGEYLILEALLTFPHRMWRIAADHILDPPDTDEARRKELVQLRETLAMEEERAAFLQAFSRQVTRRAR